jgi:hypothetical protein
MANNHGQAQVYIMGIQNKNWTEEEEKLEKEWDFEPMTYCYESTTLANYNATSLYQYLD